MVAEKASTEQVNITMKGDTVTSTNTSINNSTSTSRTTGPTRVFPRIKVIRAYTTKETDPNESDPKESAEQDAGASTTKDQGADCHDVEDEHWINGYPIPIANPMSGYAQYAGTRKSWGINALGTLVVEIETEAEDSSGVGVCGVGVSIGGEPGCYIVEKHLSIDYI